MNIKKKQQGFTLIELMIVIAIVGILAAIALPAYQDYLVRSRMSEPMAAMAEAKTSVAEYLASRNTLPPTQTAAGIETARPSAAYISSIEYYLQGAQAVIVARVTQGPNAAIPTSSDSGRSFSMFGTVNQTQNTIGWVCTNGDNGGADPVKSNYLPATCR